MTYRTRYALMFILAWASLGGAVLILCILDMFGVESMLFRQHPVDCYLWLYTVQCLVGMNLAKKDALRNPPPAYIEKPSLADKYIIRTLPKLSDKALQWIARVLYIIEMVVFTVVSARLIVFLSKGI